MKIVLDTNCLIMSLSPKSRYRIIWKAFLEERFDLCVSNEIMAEYEEVISRNINSAVANLALSIISNASNVKYINPHFNFWMVEADIDDNKFTDCAVAAQADYIVTEDHHFKSAMKVDFPKVIIIGINQFMALI